MAIDVLLASGTLFGASHVALLGQSKMLAGNAGVSAGEAAKEWTARSRGSRSSPPAHGA
jgi:hypothetical protein